MTIDGNGSYCALDPYEGGKIVVAEAARNIACSGAEPFGMTDCLNYGSPEKPEVFYMFERSVSGVADASAFFKIPVTGGNVSLYNESPQGAIDPTPIVGMIGLFKDVSKRVTQWFKKDGDFIYLLGNIGDSIGASRYLHLLHGKKTGLCPKLDLGTEQKLHRLLVDLAQEGTLQSAHDCSEGGLAVALAESCFSGMTHEEAFHGAKVSLPGQGRLDGRLFGEAQSRAVVSCDPKDAAKLEAAAKKLGVPFEKIGLVGGDQLAIDQAIQLPVEKAADLFNNAIEKLMA
jgi:phosphoribosylformylglycinamidine synthase